jgi:hypothetical protein
MHGAHMNVRYAQMHDLNAPKQTKYNKVVHNTETYNSLIKLEHLKLREINLGHDFSAGVSATRVQE